MSSSILDQLEAKPVPKKQQQYSNIRSSRRSSCY